MQKYRVKNKPNVTVEAEQLTPENVDRLANECQGQIVEEGRDKASMKEGINVKTPNGKERLHQGMYLVKVDGKFYTAAAVNFEMRYEPDVPVAIDVETVGYPPKTIYKTMKIDREDIVEPPSLAPTTTDDPWKDVPRIKDVP